MSRRKGNFQSGEAANSQVGGSESIKSGRVQNPQVSVIIPIYNCDNYLAKCIDSVLKQTLKNIEIICVNDGSTDTSLDIVKEFAVKDSRIKVIDKKHTGYGDTLNKGIASAKGEYIGIIESDDIVAPEMYETLYRLSENGSVDIVKGNYWDYYIDETDSTDPQKYYVNNDRNSLPNDNKPFTFSDNPWIIIGRASIWSAIYKKEFLEKSSIGFKNGELVDSVFLFEVLCKAKSIVWTKEPLYYSLRNNPDSLSANVDNPELPFIRMAEILDILEKNNCMTYTIKRAYYTYVVSYLNSVLSNFDHDKHFDAISAATKQLMQRFDKDIMTSEFNLNDQLTYFTYTSPLESIKAASSKILIYNWLPFDNPWGWGGGVTIYCKNIIAEMLKARPDINIYFLSSGFAYNSNTTKIFTRKIDNMFGNRVHQFEIVNSPVPAEQRNLYVNPLVALENPDLKEVFADFLKEYGPFNAIHFNNIEGLSFDVLDLKEDFPDTRFIFSIHNYVPLCVNGSYYMRHKHCNCNPDHTGVDCFKCTRADIRSNLAVETYKRGLFGMDPKQCISQSRWIKAFGFERLDQDVSTDDILDFAKTATAKINKNCDDILAVSKRVYEIAADNGFDESKMSVSYIGTQVAARQIGHATAEVSDGLKIVFLGSDINFEEKGYAFLLDTLSQLDIKYASKIDLLLTVKQAGHAEIYTMLKNFRSLKVVQGYTHDDLGWIFEGAHLSLVPVLWEDNLPQIAIESVAYGVPVLTSSSGGAKELCDSPLFRFECGNSKDMLKKIIHFLENPKDLKEYWKHHNGLVTMSEHWEELSKYYGLDKREPIVISPEDYDCLLRENQFLYDNISFKEHSYDVLEDLHRKLSEANAQNEKLKQEMKEMEKINGKLIFQSDYNPVQGDAGATLFKLTLEDFNFSDFYAEIKFVRISNVDASYSDVLRISGTWFDEDGKRSLHLHQIDWAGKEINISDWVYYYIRDNSVYFFAKYSGKFTGFVYEIQTLASRASHDSVKYEPISNGFIYENETKPEDAFNSLGSKTIKTALSKRLKRK